MADRYWVGGTDNWNGTAGTKWATTSGGAGGAAVPTASDNVYFDLNSGAVTVTVTVDSVCNSLSCTSGAGNFAGTITGSANLTVSGSLTLVSGMTWTFTGRTITFNSTATGNTITSAGKTLCTAITFNGVGGGWQFVDAATCLGALTLTAGAVDFNNNAITAGTFSSSNSNTRSIAFGTGSLTVNGSGANLVNMGTITNWSYTGSGKINVSNNTATASTITTNGSEAQVLNFYINAGTYALSETNAFYKTLDLTGFSGTLPNTARRIYGDLVVSSTVTLTAGANATTFISSSASPAQTITTNGKTLDFPLIVSAPGATYKLIDNLTIGSTRAFTLTRGTFDANGKNVSVGSFALGSGTKTLTIGSGTWTCAGNWDANTNVANLTVSASTGTISMTSASAKTFSGGGLTWPTLNQGGAGTLTIAQSNTFANITNTVQPATIRFTAGTTQTVSAFSVSGTSGNQITLDTTVAGTLATLNGTTGIVNARYVNIKDIRAQGYTEWNALVDQGAVDQGNNPGWNFITLGVKKILRRVFGRQIIRPVIEEIS